MAENAGFLEQLTGGAGDEKAKARAIIGQDIASGGRMASMGYGLGQQAVAGLGPVIQGLLGGVSGGRIGGGKKGAGFESNFNAAHDKAEDNLTAHINQITVEELRGRRAVREALGNEEFADDKKSSARYKMAERAYEVSVAAGDEVGATRAAVMMKQIQEQDAEFAKLEQESAKQAVSTAYDSEGEPVSGRIMRDESGAYVLEHTDAAGQLVRTPFGTELTAVDPRVGTNRETLDQAIRRGISRSQLAALENQITTQSQTMRQSRRVIKSLQDYGDQAAQVISKSGDWVSGIDNFIRNVSGLVETFAPGGSALDAKEGWREDAHGAKEYWSGRDAWAGKADDATDSIWKLFPEELRQTSAAAQQHRAQIMEMAYMAARLAEPSNRGLSDNDIQNALRRIAGDSSNPQVITRRFIEMIGDAMFDVENKMGIYAGRFSKIATEEEIHMAIGGETYAKLRKQRDELFKDVGVSLNDDGRAVFESPIDNDVQPVEAAPVSVEDQSLQEFEESLFGTNP